MVLYIRRQLNLQLFLDFGTKPRSDDMAACDDDRVFSLSNVRKKSNAQFTHFFLEEVVLDTVRRNVSDKTQHYLNALHTANLLLQKRTASWKSIFEIDDTLITPDGAKDRANPAAPRAKKGWQKVRDMQRTESDKFRDLTRQTSEQVRCSVLKNKNVEFRKSQRQNQCCSAKGYLCVINRAGVCRYMHVYVSVRIRVSFFFLSM